MRLPKKEFSIQHLNKAISTRHQLGRGGAGDTTIIDIHAKDNGNEVSIKVDYHKERQSESCLCVRLDAKNNISTHWLSDDQIKYIVTLITEFCKQQKIELI